MTRFEYRGFMLDVCRHMMPVEHIKTLIRAAIGGGIFPNLLCAGRDECLRFIEDVLDEIIELFARSRDSFGNTRARTAGMALTGASGRIGRSMPACSGWASWNTN